MLGSSQVGWNWTNIISSLLIALIAAALALATRALFEWRDSRGVRAQIIFLLTVLATRMGTHRDYPVNSLHGFDKYLERLVDRAFSTDAARALNEREKASIFAAILETEQSLEFLSHERERFLADQAEYKEYMVAAASRAVEKLTDALDLFGAASRVIYPPDPRGLHNWQPGHPIPRRK